MTPWAPRQQHPITGRSSGLRIILLATPSPRRGLLGARTLEMLRHSCLGTRMVVVAFVPDHSGGSTVESHHLPSCPSLKRTPAIANYSVDKDAPGEPGNEGETTTSTIRRQATSQRIRRAGGASDRHMQSSDPGRRRSQIAGTGRTSLNRAIRGTYPADQSRSWSAS